MNKKQEIRLYLEPNLCQNNAMNSNNPEELAKAYLDAWQQQWSQIAADPAWQQAAAQQWQQFASGMMAGMPPAFAGAGSSQQSPSDNVKTNDTRPTSTSATPELGAQLLAECFTRLARLEARLADLESKVSK